MTLRVLIVDDDPGIRRLVRASLNPGTAAWEAEDADGGLAMLAREVPDVAFCDVVMPGGGGRRFAEEARRILPGCAVIGMSGEAGPGDVVDMLRHGMADFLPKPFDREAVVRSLSRARRLRALRDELARAGALDSPGTDPFAALLGESESFRDVLSLLRRLATADAGVLVVGATGTGKSLVARCLHEAGPRRDQPFIVVPCGALSPSLVEVELFGHAPGAFTGAGSLRLGAFESASGGTLVLSEVGALPPRMQAALLRAAEGGFVQRVGEATERRVDVRIIATSSEDLGRLVETGRLREDLRHRLDRVRVTLPRLRDRGDDLLLLAARLLEDIARRSQRRVPALSSGAVRKLRAHEWPGNVRELANVLEHACLMSGWDAVIDEADIRLARADEATERLDPGSWPLPEAGIGLVELLRAVETDLIRQALQRSGGHHERAAELLRLPRTTLERRLARAPRTD